jgi:DNA-repair protein complementing XP-A cells
MVLTDEQRALIEENRERAKRIRLSKYIEAQERSDSPDNTVQHRIQSLGGGGFIPEDDEEAELLQAAQAQEEEEKATTEIVWPLSENETCKVCGSIELDDFLRKHYRVHVCSNCRESLPDRFGLITKTTAKETFLLTDEELRDTSLMPFITKPNPHKSHWSSMQLYLKEQVRAFALDKWGSLEAIEEEAQRRADLQQSQKEKKFVTSLQELRRKTKGVKRANSSTTANKAHKHQFTESTDEATGELVQTCTECSLRIVSEEL